MVLYPALMCCCFFACSFVCNISSFIGERVKRVITNKSTYLVKGVFYWSKWFISICFMVHGEKKSCEKEQKRS